MHESVHRICLFFCQRGILPPARSDINMSEFTGLIRLELCIVSAFRRFGLSNFPAAHYRKSIADIVAVNGLKDSKQWEVGGRARSFPMAFRDS